MRKVNFNSLSSYQAPQEWIEKAAAIPTTVQKKRVIPLYRIAAAASIVLVSVIGLLLFLFLGDGKAPIAVRSRSIAASETSMENAAGETTVTGEPVPHETIAVLSTDAEGNPVIVYQEKPASTENGTQPTNGRQKPTENAPSPTTSAAPIAPTATDASGQPVPSTERPPAPTEAPAVPDPPATEPPPPPTDPPLTDCRITVTTGYPPPDGEMPSVETDEPIVFCRMYDAAGNLVGSSRPFAEEKRATVISINPDNTFVVTYDPLEKGLPITRGRYTYVMVDYYLGTELCRGTIEY